MKKENDLTSGCLGAITVAFMAAVNFFVNSLELMLVWSWFVVPIFKLSGLSFWQSAGLNVLVVFLVGGRGTDSNDDLWESSKKQVLALAVSLIWLLIAWLVSFAV